MNWKQIIGGIIVGIILGIAGTFFLFQDRIISPKERIQQPEVDLSSTMISKNINHLSSPNPHEKISASRALGDMGKSAEIAIHYLIKALDDEDFITISNYLGGSDINVVSREAGYALVKIGDKSIVPLVEYLTNTKNSYGAGVAAEALGKLKAKQAVDILINTLRNTSFDYWPRMHAAEALGEINDIRAIEPLIAVGDDTDDDSDVVKNRAALALRKITGMDYGFEDPKKWKNWWENNKGTFNTKKN